MAESENKFKEMEEYIKNPTAYSSLPYYKTKSFKILDGILVLKDSDFSISLLNDYWDEPYFKLCNDLEKIGDFFNTGWL